MKYQIRFINACISVFVLLSLGMAYQENPEGKAGVNGSPGEQTCAKSNCHNSFGLNSGNGSVTISSSDLTNWNYTPGQTYNISVTVEQPGIELFGFGFEALASDGTNAGTLIAGPGSHALTANVGGVSRLTISQIENSGTTLNSHTWNFTWIAPSTGIEVTFYAVGNAANGNGGRTGDYIYSTSQALTFSTNPPNAPFIMGGGNDTICEGSFVNLSVSDQIGVTMNWYNQQDVLIGSENSISIGTEGCYHVVASNAAGTVNSVNEVCITVTPIDNSVSITADHFTANQSGAQYQWLNCDDENAEIPGANAQTYAPSDFGNYAVELTLSGCSEISECISLLTNSSYLDSPAKKELVQFSSLFKEMVIYNNHGGAIDIINTSGKIVFTDQHPSTITRLNTASWPAGIYFVRSTTNKKSSITKVLIY